MLALFQDAVLEPGLYGYVWGGLGAIALTVCAAGYTAWNFEWLWARKNVEVTLDEADISTSRLLWVYTWFIVRTGACLTAVTSKFFHIKSMPPTLKRCRACLACAISALMESLSFWFDVLWLHGMWLNEDVRYRTFAVCATAIYAIGCTAYAAISLRLIFPLRTAHLDAKQIYPNPGLWAGIVVTSWCASPSLLTLLPWSCHAFANFPTMLAMDAIFVTKSCFKSALIILKISLIVRLKAGEQLITFTLFLNLVVFLRSQMQRSLTLSALRALRTRWTRVKIFISYRVDSDQGLARDLHEKLIASGLSVWFDEKCLQAGQRWEDGFANGLLTSKIFLPILSREGLARFAHLTEDSEIDNVLLEHLLALEQCKRLGMRAVCPVLVGACDLHGIHGHFFKQGGMPTCSTLPVQAAEAKAREHLAREFGAQESELLVEDRSPRGILNELVKYQGEFVIGDSSLALDRITRKMCEVAKDVASHMSEGGIPADDYHLADVLDAIGRRLTGLCYATLMARNCATSLQAAAAGRIWHSWRLQPAEGDSAHLAAASCGDVSDYFATSELMEEAMSNGQDNDNNDGSLVVNPILLQKAKWQQEKEASAKQRSRTQAAQKNIIGRLAKLNLTVVEPLSPLARDARDVDRYIRRHENVATASSDKIASPAASTKTEDNLKERRWHRDSLLQQHGTRASRLSSVRHTFAGPRLKVSPTPSTPQQERTQRAALDATWKELGRERGFSRV